MNSIARLTLIALAVGLSACTVHRPSEPTVPPIETLPPTGPVIRPVPGPKPSTPATLPTLTSDTTFEAFLQRLQFGTHETWHPLRGSALTGSALRIS